MMNPIVQLAASALPGERKYLLLAGAGVSKDAGLPTAWDVMLETAKLLYCSEREGTPSREELESWFIESPYAKMPYAEVIGGMYRTYPDQQAFLNTSIGGRPIGQAHRHIAELARRRVIRAVITTNFDDNIERALEAVGLPVQVISNDEDLVNSEPLIHSKVVRVYKPHSTLGRGALRNTPADLERLSPVMAEELTRIAGEHGMIVLGYSGSDPGIFKVLRNRRRNLYPLFWVDPALPRQEIMQFLSDNGYSYVPCSGASAFLGEYFSLLERLDRISAGVPTGPRLHDLERSLEAGNAAVGALFTDYVNDISSELSGTRPDFTASAEPDEAILEQIEKGTGAVLRFGEAAALAARYSNSAAAKALFQSFSTLWALCQAPFASAIGHQDWHSDGFRFLIYEMLVIWAAKLIERGCWELIGEILSEDLFLDHRRTGGYERYPVLRLHAASLDEYRRKRLNLHRMSVTSDHVNMRITKGPLAKAVPAGDFKNADYFLYLRSALLEETEDERGRISLADVWIPRSCLFLDRTPSYLAKAQSARFLRLLSKACGVPEDVFKQRVIPRCNQFVHFFDDAFFLGFDDPIDPETLRWLGSRP